MDQREEDILNSDGIWEIEIKDNLEDVLGPAFERRPATEAVAMMEPDGCGLEGEVRRMAPAAYLVARKTLFEAN